MFCNYATYVRYVCIFMRAMLRYDMSVSYVYASGALCTLCILCMYATLRYGTRSGALIRKRYAKPPLRYASLRLPVVRSTHAPLMRR